MRDYFYLVAVRHLNDKQGGVFLFWSPTIIEVGKTVVVDTKYGAQLATVKACTWERAGNDSLNMALTLAKLRDPSDLKRVIGVVCEYDYSEYEKKEAVETTTPKADTF